jgi:hypothetical protein
VRARGESGGAAAKTWGPFTGRQLTTIICVAIVTVLLPVGAWAVTGTTSFITDHTTGKTATVNASGQLVTNAVITGPVAAPDASPKNIYNSVGVGTGGTYAPVATPPAGQALIITSITDAWYTVNALGGNDYLEFAVSKANATCATTGSHIFTDAAGALGTKVFNLPSGLVVPAGRSLCVRNSDSANLGVSSFAGGYRVLASAAPAGS